MLESASMAFVLLEAIWLVNFAYIAFIDLFSRPSKIEKSDLSSYCR